MGLRLKINKTVIFDEFTHTYISKTNDKLLIGVTSLMKKHGLAPDYGNIPQEILERAAQKGTAIHEMLQAYDEGRSVKEDIDGNLEAYKALGLKVDRSEYLVTDDNIVASFVDKVLEDCSLADVKTTSSVHKRSVSWQLSIYAYLFEMMNPSKKVPHLYCIHVRDGKAKLIEVERIPDEQVARLIECEKEGCFYFDNVEIPSAGDAFSDTEINELVSSFETIAKCNEIIKAEEMKVAALKMKMYDYMEKNSMDEMGCDYGTFSRKASYVRKSFNSSAFRKEHPDMYSQYQTETTVAGTINFKSI